MRKKKLFLIIFILFILLVIASSIYTYKTKPYKLDNQKQLKTYLIKLNECFDFDNSSFRSINDSLELVEYCVIEFPFE